MLNSSFIFLILDFCVIYSSKKILIYLILGLEVSSWLLGPYFQIYFQV